MEELKHEADALAPEARELVFAQLDEIDPVDENAAFGWRVEPCNQTEERRLAASRRAHDGEELPLRHFEIEWVKNREILGATGDDFLDLFEANHWSIGFKYFQTFSATIRAPAALGCLPSDWLSAATPATFSSRLGMKVTSRSSAS